MQSTGSTGTISTQVSTYKGLTLYSWHPSSCIEQTQQVHSYPSSLLLIVHTGTLSTQVPYIQGFTTYLERQVDVLLIVPTGTISGSPHTFNTKVPYFKGLPPYNKHTVLYFKWFTTIQTGTL